MTVAAGSAATSSPTIAADSAPDAMVLDFFQSTYEAVADLAKWKRSELEYHGAHPERAVP